MRGATAVPAKAGKQSTVRMIGVKEITRKALNIAGFNLVKLSKSPQHSLRLIFKKS